MSSSVRALLQQCLRGDRTDSAAGWPRWWSVVGDSFPGLSSQGFWGAKYQSRFCSGGLLWIWLKVPNQLTLSKGGYCRHCWWAWVNWLTHLNAKSEVSRSQNATYGHYEPGMPTSPLPFDLAFRILSLIPSLHFKCHLLFLLKSNLCDKLTGDFTFVAGILNV